MVCSSYQCDDWRRLQLNDTVEDAFSKNLWFGFDIGQVEVKPAAAKTLRDQILAWAKHIAGENSRYTKWQEIYDFTFEALYAPDAVFGNDDTPIGTEADLVAELQDFELERDYALQDKETEREYLTNHHLFLGIASSRQDIRDRIPIRYFLLIPFPLGSPCSSAISATPTGYENAWSVKLATTTARSNSLPTWTTTSSTICNLSKCSCVVWIDPTNSRLRRRWPITPPMRPASFPGTISLPTPTATTSSDRSRCPSSGSILLSVNSSKSSSTGSLHSAELESARYRSRCRTLSHQDRIRGGHNRR